MKRLIARVTTMLAGAALASAVFTPQVAAAPPVTSLGTPGAPDATTVSHIVTHTARAGVLEAAAADATDYWTPERMREAVELDKIELSRLPDLGDVRVGEPMSVAPSPVGDLLRAPRLLGGLTGAGAADESTGSPWTGGGNVVATAGRVFFTVGGRDASCSGNAVTSENKSTVITAGHCVKYQGSWHADWIFVPAYHQGEAPYGEWPAVSTHTTPQWHATEDIDYDIGAAVVRSVDGQRLTDVVGGQGIAFNQPRGQRTYAFGYPAADPYDGSRLVYCAGTTFNDYFFSNDLGLNCDMTGGSSGGPWFIGFDPQRGTGMQNSVNSFGYVFLPDVMFGPYFGDAARQLYQDVQRR